MIGQTVMMISPWSEPLPLMRAWCIWELYCTESVGAPFAVCLGPAEQDALEAAILGNSSGYERVLAAFAAVDVGSAEAGDERDKVMIMEHAERSEGGLQGLNATAVSTLRRWFVEFVKGLGRRVRAHRDAAEGVFQMTVVAHVLNSMGEQLEALRGVLVQRSVRVPKALRLLCAAALGQRLHHLRILCLVELFDGHHDGRRRAAKHVKDLA